MMSGRGCGPRLKTLEVHRLAEEWGEGDFRATTAPAALTTAPVTCSSGMFAVDHIGDPNGEPVADRVEFAVAVIPSGHAWNRLTEVRLGG
jgi:hypothetical protein